jgi:hypothetical protein
LAREVIAYEDVRSGNTAKALRAYQQIAADPETPSSLKKRAEAMSRFLKAGGDANYGTVPATIPAQKSTSANRPRGVPIR